jgi:hypothetical protein
VFGVFGVLHAFVGAHDSLPCSVTQRWTERYDKRKSQATWPEFVGM